MVSMQSKKTYSEVMDIHKIINSYFQTQKMLHKSVLDIKKGDCTRRKSFEFQPTIAKAAYYQSVLQIFYAET